MSSDLYIDNKLKDFFMGLELNNMTMRELRFIKVYLETSGNATEAAWQVYNCSNRDSAKALGYKVKRRLFYKK